MPPLDDVFYLTTLDQVHTLADPLRVRILERLAREAMTVTMLGAALGEAPGKTHYHVREMERVGVIRLVETREKGGVLEKYYRAIAQRFSISPDLLHTPQPAERSEIFHEVFGAMERGALAAFQRHLDHPDLDEPIALSGETIWATKAEYEALLKRIFEMARPYHEPQGITGEQEWTLNLVGHVAAPEPSAVDTPAGSPSVRRSFAIGAFEYTHDELARIVAEGRQLDLTVVGMCAFAPDVTPELADRAVARIRVYGALRAAPDVRAALLRKGGERQMQA